MIVRRTSWSWKRFCYENMSKASNFQESCWRLNSRWWYVMVGVWGLLSSLIFDQPSTWSSTTNSGFLGLWSRVWSWWEERWRPRQKPTIRPSTSPIIRLDHEEVDGDPWRVADGEGFSWSSILSFIFHSKDLVFDHQSTHDSIFDWLIGSLWKWKKKARDPGYVFDLSLRLRPSVGSPMFDLRSSPSSCPIVNQP